MSEDHSGQETPPHRLRVVGNSYHPIFKTHGEGVGVKPDIKVTLLNALHTAPVFALEKNYGKISIVFGFGLVIHFKSQLPE
jgi:hypothetical protein